MSLEELLREPQISSPWKLQREKLLRVGLGILTISFALSLAVSLLFSTKREKNSMSQVEGRFAADTDLSPEEQESSEALAQLMRLRDETRSLKAELSQLKRQPSRSAQPSPSAGGARATGVSGAGVSTVVEPVISFDPGEGFVTLDRRTRDVYIPTGSVFQARLVTPIKTSVERTFVMAETTNEFRMDMDRRIPKGSRLIGRSRLNPVLKGVIVEFDTLVLPNGIETQISGLALSRNALPEIDGLYFSDRLQTYGTALAFGFLSGFADAGRRREVTALGARLEETLSNQVLAGLSTASFQVAEDMLRDIRNRAVEYVVVPAGEPVFVALTRRYEVDQGRQRP